MSLLHMRPNAPPMGLAPELREKYSVDPGNQDDPDDYDMATITCNKCNESWDVRMPLGKGAASVLLHHYDNKHGPRGAFHGEIRRRSWRSRLEKKVDNIAAMVSYLPGMKR